jgi:lipoate---protein ligase
VLSVIVDDTRDPARNLALDEALVRTAAGPRPVLRVWQNAPSVIVGRFQDVTAVIDLPACARDGVRVLRRASGGGALFTDAGSLLVTLVFAHPTTRPDLPHTVLRPAVDGPVWRRPRPDLDVLLAGVVGNFGLPDEAIGEVVRTSWQRTRHATLAHACLHVTPVGGYGRSYLLSGAEPRTLADYGLPITLDAVRAAILGAIVDRYGVVCARQSNPLERRCRDHLLALRYNEVTWHLTGAAGSRAAMGFLRS